MGCLLPKTVGAAAAYIRACGLPVSAAAFAAARASRLLIFAFLCIRSLSGSCVWRWQGQRELCRGCFLHGLAGGIALTTSARCHQPMACTTLASPSSASCASTHSCIPTLRPIGRLPPVRERQARTHSTARYCRRPFCARISRICVAALTQSAARLWLACAVRSRLRIASVASASTHPVPLSLTCVSPCIFSDLCSRWRLSDHLRTPDACLQLRFFSPVAF
jgi:hypothetical protein